MHENHKVLFKEACCCMTRYHVTSWPDLGVVERKTHQLEVMSVIMTALGIHIPKQDMTAMT